NLIEAAVAGCMDKVESVLLTRSSKCSMEVVHVRHYWCNRQYWKDRGNGIASGRRESGGRRQERGTPAAACQTRRGAADDRYHRPGGAFPRILGSASGLPDDSPRYNEPGLCGVSTARGRRARRRCETVGSQVRSDP